MCEFEGRLGFQFQRTSIIRPGRTIHLPRVYRPPRAGWDTDKYGWSRKGSRQWGPYTHTSIATALTDVTVVRLPKI